MRQFFICSLVAVLGVALCACNPKEEVQQQPASDSTATAKYVLTLSPEHIRLRPGQKTTLSVNLTPISTNPIVWESSDPSVASVMFGNITAKTEGKTTITASCEGVSAFCEVEVATPQYQLIWEENFDGDALNTSYWTSQTGGGGGNQEKQYYTENGNIGIQDGILTITARKEDYTSSVTGVTYNYTSARLITKDKIKFTYGKVEARISMPSGQGTWPAFWMMPNDNVYGGWPRSGEIDIVEHVGSDPRMVSYAYHAKNHNTQNGTNWGKRTYHDDVEGSFHVYGLMWEEDYLDGCPALIFTFDGDTTSFRVKEENWDWQDWPFDKDFYLILNLAMGGTWGGTIDDAIFEHPVEMKVDWVRVYQRKYADEK